MDTYIGLHRHSTFSAMDGMGTAEQIRDRLLEIGQTAMGLTDHGVSTGHPEFFRVFKTAGIKLVPGVEFYHCEDLHHRGVKSETNQEGQRTARASLPHLTVLALNRTGYQNLLALHRLSYRQGFYYRPRIDTPALIRHQKGLVVLSGCVGGQIARLINTDKEDLAFQWLRYFQQNIEHFYAEITPITGLGISERHCRVLWKMAGELKLPRVCTDDAHFPRPQDYAVEDTMTARAIGTTVDAPDRKLRLPAECYHCTSWEIMARLQTVLPEVPKSHLEAAVYRTQVIADQCTVEPPRASGPVFNIQTALAEMPKEQPVIRTPEGVLRNWVAQGMAQRGLQNELPDPQSPEWDVYRERAEYEFSILKHHGFTNYCLVIADIVRWARQENILCIARGSCGGSLLMFCLGITELDPIKYDLPVERFIGFHRRGLPDVDLDVDSRHRDRFWMYLTTKYGEANCAQIAALSRFRTRQALRDVAAAYELPDEVLAEALELAPEVDDAEEGLKAVGTLKRLFTEHPRAQALAKEYPALLIAAELEGQIRQSTIHAAGFVVDARPIHETVGIMGKPDSLPVAACDMVEAEKLGLLKIDLLGVDMLGVLATVAEKLGHSAEWVRRLPLDDLDTYAMLAAGRNAGVFQLQGNTAGRLMRDLRPTRYEDVCDVVALARPGPLQSGGASTFGARHRGAQPAPALHPILAKILDPTHGVVLYQESVMQIMREAGGFEWDEVENIRKIISKIEGAHAMERYLDGYLMGCAERGISESDALLTWEQCLKAGGYLFNKAHSYDYGKKAVWGAYLKRHHPAEFAAAFAQFADNEDKIAQARRVFDEFRALGGRFILIDPNKSQIHFTALDDHTILGGFQDLESCGPKSAEKLVAGQPYEDWNAFYRACPKTLRDHLYATGIHEGRVDQDAVLHIAPWYVEITYSDLERAAAERMSAITVAAAHHADRGEIRLVGRITQVETINVVAEAKKYGQRPPGPGEPTLRAVVTLADETGSTLLNISPRRFEQLVAQRNPLRGPYEGVGNSCYALCSWNRPHTKLYCEDMIAFREAPLFVPTTPDELDPVLVKKKATRKRKKIDAASDGRAIGGDSADGTGVVLADSPDESRDTKPTQGGEHSVPEQDERSAAGDVQDSDAVSAFQPTGEAAGGDLRGGEAALQQGAGDARDEGACGLAPDEAGVSCLHQDELSSDKLFRRAVCETRKEASNVGSTSGRDALVPQEKGRKEGGAEREAARDPIVDSSPWE